MASRRYTPDDLARSFGSGGAAKTRKTVSERRDSAIADKRNVFVVYGRNADAHNALFPIPALNWIKAARMIASYKRVR
jgi:hypothetical protein